MSTVVPCTATSSAFGANSGASTKIAARSIRLTAWATVLTRNDERDLALRWSGRLSLTQRILAVNIFALVILAGSFFYLDSYRARATEGRLEQIETEAKLIAAALEAAPPAARTPLLNPLGAESRTRLRIYAPFGGKIGRAHVLTPVT